MRLCFACLTLLVGCAQQTEAPVQTGQESAQVVPFDVKMSFGDNRSGQTAFLPSSTMSSNGASVSGLSGPSSIGMDQGKAANLVIVHNHFTSGSTSTGQDSAGTSNASAVQEPRSAVDVPIALSFAPASQASSSGAAALEGSTLTTSVTADQEAEAVLIRAIDSPKFQNALGRAIDSVLSGKVAILEDVSSNG